MFEKEVIIDAHGHLLGRLTSVIAKQLISGQRIVVVRAEETLKSGSHFRNMLVWKKREHHRINTNPRRGAKHYTAPSRMFWKTVRGMLPHKTPRGAAALEKLKVFEGIPHPYDHQKRMVIPDALKVLRMKSYRKFCKLGDISSAAGWTKADVIKTLEEKRKARSANFHSLKAKKDAARAKALNDPKVAQFNKALAKHGF